MRRSQKCGAGQGVSGGRCPYRKEGGLTPRPPAPATQYLLHYAAANGHKDVAALLLERGADKEAKGNVSGPNACGALCCPPPHKCEREVSHTCTCVNMSTRVPTLLAPKGRPRGRALAPPTKVDATLPLTHICDLPRHLRPQGPAQGPPPPSPCWLPQFLDGGEDTCGMCDKVHICVDGWDVS